MHNQSRTLHTGYESTKSYQAEMRDMRAQDRLARQVRAPRPAGSPRSLTALLRRLSNALWANGRREEGSDGIAAHPDAPDATAVTRVTARPLHQ